MHSAFVTGSWLLMVAVLASGCGERPIVSFDRGVAHDQHGERITCPGGTLCSGSCVDTASDPRHCGKCGTVCCSDTDPTCDEPQAECVQGRCLHPGGKMDCSGAVIDPTSDPNNCGDCGITCDPAKGFACVAGKCACVGGMTDCSGKCVDTATDPENCGACGVHCSSSCTNGTC